MLNVRPQLPKGWASWETSGNTRIVHGQPVAKRVCESTLRQSMSTPAARAVLSVTNFVPRRMPGASIRADSTKVVEIQD